MIGTAMSALRRGAIREWRDGGFALLVVLWTLVLLGLLTTRLVASGRTAINLAGNLRAAAEARALADGAINDAVFHVLATGPAHWQPDDTVHHLREGPVTVTVRIRSLAGMINPNIAPPALLAGLFQAVGATRNHAQSLAQAVITWRSPPLSARARKTRLARYRRAGLAYGPPGRRFSDLAELGDVIGMTPRLLAKCRPHMSLHQHAAPDPAFADPVVRRALTIAGSSGQKPGRDLATPVIEVDARALGPNALSARRQAIVSIPGTEALTPFRFLLLTSCSHC